MNVKTDTQRVKAMHERRKAEGLKQVRVWIPLEREDQIKLVAEAMREGRQISIHEKQIMLPETVLKPPKRED